MTAPIKNSPYYPVPLKILANTAAYSILSAPFAAAAFKTPKPVIGALGLMTTALLATYSWEVYQNHKPIPTPKRS